MILKKDLDVKLMYDEEDSFGISLNNDFEFFRNLLEKYNPEANFKFLKKAFAICAFYHKNDYRKSGKKYYTHPLWVAIILIKEFQIYDEIYLAAAFLHDTIEDTANKRDRLVKEAISEKMGNDYLGVIVDALTKISHERLIIENEGFRNQLIQRYTNEKVDELLKNKQIQKCFTHRKLFQTFVKDQNIIVIKLADRLHNMRTLHYKELGDEYKYRDRMREYAEETLEFYVRFANRLGFSSIAGELQNLSFYFSSNKEVYSQIRELIESKEKFILDRIGIFEKDIREAFADSEFKGISTTIFHRKEYEIYSLTNQFQNPDALPDFVHCIVSIPVSDYKDLRKATSKIIQQFGHSNISNYQEGKQILGEFEFNTIQIKLKKNSGDSLDVTIMSTNDSDILDNITEVPIKEKRLKKKVSGISDEHLELWSDWMEYVILEKGEKAIKDIWNSLDKNLFDDKIVCFSIDKQEIQLPQGATVLDFAFAISKDIGLSFSKARISEQVFDFDYKLYGNETIQILTSKIQQPIPEWQYFISDYRALGYFYNYLKSKNLLNNDFANELLTQNHIQHISAENKLSMNLEKGFFAKLMIKGNDRKHLLNDITNAIGDSEIRKSTIQRSDLSSEFEGIFEVNFRNLVTFNKVVLKLLDVRNVKSTELIDIWSKSIS